MVEVEDEIEFEVEVERQEFVQTLAAETSVVFVEVWMERNDVDGQV